MELLDLEPAGLAPGLDTRTAPTQRYAYLIAGLIAVRLVVAAVLPLSFDESYYWLWSKHLAAGYYDHPPMIALAIRAGTVVFGNTALGVRILPLLFSVLASWAVWRAGAEYLGQEEDGARASLLFNLTLMCNVEMLTGTPDAPLMAFSALFVLALVRLEVRGDGRWWLAAGAAGGLALLSKYTALFLAAGALAYLVLSPKGRRWLLSPLPYLGVVLALLLFAPDLWWNAQHDWVSFAFQFSKAANAHLAPQHLLGFFAAQAALASPLILVLAVIGLLRARGLFLALCLPAIAFFMVHALQARVEGNWPSFLYPALALAAAAGWRAARSAFALFTKRWAIAVAALFLAVSYGQALFAFLPLPDPTAHLLASGFPPVADNLAELRVREGADAFVTTSYALTGWLSFYNPGDAPVIQLNEPQRWLSAPLASKALLRQPMLYVVEPRRDRSAMLAADFTSMRRLPGFVRVRAGHVVSRYNVYLLRGWRGRLPERIANRP